MFYIIFYSFILFAIVIFFFNFVFSKITDTITKISNKSFFSYIRFIYNRICVCTEKRVLYPYIKFWDNLYLILCGILFQFQAAIFSLVFMLPDCRISNLFPFVNFGMKISITYKKRYPM